MPIKKAVFMKKKEMVVCNFGGDALHVCILERGRLNDIILDEVKLLLQF